MIERLKEKRYTLLHLLLAMVVISSITYVVMYNAGINARTEIIKENFVESHYCYLRLPFLSADASAKYHQIDLSKDECFALSSISKYLGIYEVEDDFSPSTQGNMFYLNQSSEWKW